jgi:hypothetical protein
LRAQLKRQSLQAPQNDICNVSKHATKLRASLMQARTEHSSIIPKAAEI